MKKVQWIFSALAAGIIMFAISSCHKDDNPTPPGTLTLYDSLGGTAMVNDPANPGQQIEQGRLNIRSVVDSAIFVIAGDDQLIPYFTTLLGELADGNESGFQALSKNLTDFFCVATGAKDYTYTGLSMTDAHDPAINTRISEKVDSEDFDQFINDVGTGATQVGVPDYLIARVAAVASSVKGAVVQR